MNYSISSGIRCWHW